jgi:hypothetical protein
MSYKHTTGSVRKGDIYYEDDRQGASTYIDFGYDSITLRPGGAQVLYAQSDAVGIGTTAPKTTIAIAGSVSANVTLIDKDTNNSSTYTVADLDYAIFTNTRPVAQNGINSSITITLPTAANFPGRIIVVKDAGGYCETNSITIERAGSDVINGSLTSVALPTNDSSKTFMSNGATMWFTV